MGPVTDETTRRYICALLGEEATATRTTTQRKNGESTSITVGRTQRAKAGAAALQQLGRDRAVVVEGPHPPAVVTLVPYWKDRR